MNRSGTHDLAGKRIAIYARYSSLTQREASIADQVRRCQDFVQQRSGHVRPDLIFSDSAVSGASLQRPGFEKLWAVVKSRKVDIIITEDASRITREFADAALIFRDLAYLEVPLLGVGDGIDTSRKTAKLEFTFKSLMNDLYREDLRDKTKRGLEGRARAGFSTGGLPYGYGSEALEQGGRLVGKQVRIVEDQAKVVRQVFEAYAEGQSYDSIARRLTREGTPPPRATSRRRQKGWVAGTVRAFLSNEAYIGNWCYGAKEWRKPPGSNARLYRKRPDAEVIREHYEERRIVSQELWDAVQVRRHAVARKYSTGGRKKSATSPGPRSTHLLSGLIVCGVCGGSMAIAGGSSADYYRCTNAKKRGTCSNNLSLREDVAIEKILGAIRQVLMSPENILTLRREVTERLSGLAKRQTRELQERRGRLQGIEVKIAGLVDALSQGVRSDYVRRSLEELESQALREKEAIDALTKASAQAVVLPHPSVIVERALSLQDMFKRDPVAGREALTHLLGGQAISLRPDQAGHYVAEATIFPLLPLVAGSSGNLRGTGGGCAGRI